MIDTKEAGVEAFEAEALEKALREAKQLIGAGRAAEAEASLRDILERHPDMEEALYVTAVAQRYQNNCPAALETLSRLVELAPEVGRYYQEIAYNRQAAGREDAACAAFEQAVALDSSLLGAWQNLISYYHRCGQAKEADRAKQHVEMLTRMPGVLRSVASQINDGKLVRAEKLCRQYLQKNPRDVEAMRFLADIGVRLNVLDDAEFILESAVAFEPDNIPARFEYASVLRQRQKYNQAMSEVEFLLEREPGNLGFMGLYGNICAAIGQHHAALEIYRKMLPHAHARHQLWNSCGHALKTIGDIDGAVEAYRNAYREKSDFGDAFWSLANLKTYTFGEEELAAAREAEAAGDTSEDDRCHLCFALGKSAEDSGDYGEAFGYYERGNRIRREQSRYTVERNDLEVRLQMETCTPELFDKLKGSGCPAPDPIFVVGLPRAGSTLLEQILASHSRVDGTMELPNIITTAHKLNGRRKVTERPRYPEVLKELPEDLYETLGRKYIEDTRVYRADAPYFVDKMPNNFRHIGLIHLMLPNAKIINARRHPMACCFSGYKQLFAEGQEFTYGLKEIGNYYRRYVELMDHWDTVLPGKVLHVQYEEVVGDLEGQVRRILEFCGLDFEESCVNFHESSRPVRTPSAEQVRQPIYKTGVDQWRNFEEFLDPLREALGPALDRFPVKD